MDNQWLDGLIQRTYSPCLNAQVEISYKWCPTKVHAWLSTILLLSSAMASGIKCILQWICGWHLAEWCSWGIRGRGCHPEGTWQPWGKGSCKLHGINNVQHPGWGNPQTLWTGCSEKLWMLLHWKCSRPGWGHGCWTRQCLNVPSNPNHSVILGFYKIWLQ